MSEPATRVGRSRLARFAWGVAGVVLSVSITIASLELVRWAEGLFSG